MLAALKAAAITSSTHRVADMMRRKDWAKTSLGDRESWPQSLETVVRLMLDSRYAMWMSWGPERTFFCNDAYLPTVGVKRDWVIGARSDEVWKEIWPDIGPRIDRVMSTGEATWDDALLLFLERSGYSEETYHTFSYSPLYDDAGRIGGHLCVVTEETERVIGARRLECLRELGAGFGGRNQRDEFLDAVEQVLARHRKDLPFALLYLLDDGGQMTLGRACGIASDHPATLSRFGISDDELPQFAHGARPLVLRDLPARYADLPTGVWNQPPQQLALVPIAEQGHARPAGFLAVGLNPFRPLDAAYSTFLELLAGQLASGYANARAYEQQQRRADALAEIDRAKTAFFSNVSHEFRTPLTLLLGPLEDLLSSPGGLDPPALRLLEVAHRNALRLLRLVNTLLDFSRLEAGRLQATFRACDLPAVTADLAASFRSAMIRAGLEYVVDCPPLAAPVYVDPDLWERIVLNLISNAFKFTLSGRVEVKVRASDDGQRAELEVRDTGVGIPAHELAHVFERFHRVAGSEGRSAEGSGIGLALVRELVQLHHGTIDVSSEPGVGTCFRVSLPIGFRHLPADRIASEIETPPNRRRAQAYVDEALGWLPGREDNVELDNLDPQRTVTDLAGASGEGRRVVLADDNTDMRDYIRRLLEAGGYVVESCSDGAQALDAVRRNPPDLVLSDVMMPKLDGFGLLDAIRQDAALRAIPVLLLSARAGQEARIEGLNACADDYLTKPFSARELLVRVGSTLQSARLQRETERALREEAHTLDIINRVGQTIAGELDLARAVQTVTDAVTELTGAAFGSFFYEMLDANGGRQTLCSASGVPPEALDRLVVPRDAGFLAASFNGRGIVRSQDVTQDPRYDGDAPLVGVPAGHEVRSYLGVQVVSRTGDMLGGLFLGHPEPGAFTERAERLAAAIASQAAVTIDNARLFERSRRASAELVTLNSELERRVHERTEQLRRTEQQFRMLVEGVVDYAIYMLHADGTVASWNAGAERIKGYSEAEIVGRNFAHFYTPQDQAAGLPQMMLQTAAATGKAENEGWRVRKDGTRFWASVVMNAIRDSRGELLGFAKITRDVSERRGIEEQLRQAQKMEVVGQLTGGVAHDFNNLLVVILGNLETLLRQIDRGEMDAARIRRVSENALRGAQRAASLTQRLLAFARRQPLEPKPVDVNRMVANMSELLRRTLGEDITIETVLAGGLWCTHTDPNQLESAILNLAVNARDAMPEGGKLTIETANAHLDRSYSDRNAEVVPGHYVLLAISDNGIGMTRDVLAHAFEPFYTTKQIGQGTGLGLSQVYGFVKQSGGHIKIYSEVGEGTTVRIYLPRLQAEPVELASPQQAEPQMRGGSSEAILVVEDDDDVRQHSTQLLAEMGHRVFSASNAQTALELLDRQPGIQLLFSDIGLPGGMNGRQLADEAQRRHPGLKVLFTTGYANNAIVHDGRLDAGVSLLTKPFTFNALAAKVAELLTRDLVDRHVLIVEDDEQVREVIAETLQSLGYRVDEAASALEAMNRIRATAEYIDAVVVDIGLPDRRGDALAVELRAMYAKLPIVIASGYAESPLQERFRNDRCFRFLTKPYDADQLQAVLQSMNVRPRGAAPTP